MLNVAVKSVPMFTTLPLPPALTTKKAKIFFLLSTAMICYFT